MAELLLQVRNLKKHFPLRGGLFNQQIGNIKAVDGVSLDVYTGESVGLVGESGSGKTTLGKAILRLIEPTSGEVIYGGQDLCKLPEREMRHSSFFWSAQAQRLPLRSKLNPLERPDPSINVESLPSVLHIRIRSFG